MGTEGGARNRRLDWTESAVFGVLTAAMVGASPFVAFVAGRRANAALSRAAQAQKGALCQVPATLLQTVPARRRGARAIPDVPAQWHRPDGLLRTGRISAPAGTRSGSQVTVWIDQAGELVDPPMRQEDIANRVELAQGLAAASFPLGLGTIGWLALRRLERRRLNG